MINVITDCGAINDGVSSNYLAFVKAINDAIATGGDEIYFPPGIYKIQGNSVTPRSPIVKQHLDSNSQPLDMNIKFYGKGAKIICDTSVDATPSYFNGAGGGFGLVGNNISFEDLEFEGFFEAYPSTNYGYGRLIRMSGNNNIVRNCKFKYGNGGGVNVDGSYITIDGNYFDRCNYHQPPQTPGGYAGDFGTIHVENTSRYINITNNNIVDQYYSGICAFDTFSSTKISHLNISGNYIRSTLTNEGKSMGIYLLRGANRNITITNNIIERIDAEAIAMNSGTGYSGRDCVISGNIFRNCNYRGIALASDDEGGTYENYVITGNIILDSGATADHMIWMDRIHNSIVANNRVEGNQSPLSDVRWGIIFQNTCPGNIVVGNSIAYMKGSASSGGISFQCPHGVLAKNIISNSKAGLAIGNCVGANIHENVVKSCDTGIAYGADNGTSAVPKQVWGNSLLDCANRYNTTGPVLPQVLVHSGVANASSFSAYVGTGTLVAGAATITFYHVYAEDKFLVIPTNGPSEVLGVLSVSAMNPAAHTIKVRSTLSTDTRSFMVVKMFSGG